MRDTVDAIKKRRDARRAGLSTGGSSAENVTGGGANGVDGSTKRDRSRERDDHRDGGK